MTSSTSFLNRPVLLLAAVLCLTGGCAGLHSAAREGGPAGLPRTRIAVLPVHNLAGSAAPLKDIRQSTLGMLKARGVELVPDEDLEKFMAQRRIRYTGGINAGDARAFRDGLGADAVLITTLELYDETSPPKAALNMRLVSTGESPAILWVDSAGVAGDDSPGILLMGMIEDPKVLTENALQGLTGSLISYLAGEKRAPLCQAGGKFGPRVYYRSPAFNPARKYTVAVLPFLNNTERKNAGEILALEFVRGLAAEDGFTVLEPGLVRDELLKHRVVMEGGVSMDTAGVVLETLEADLVMSGNVMDYEDYQGGFGTSKISFSVLMIDRKGREVVWESRSYGEGDEYVYLFDFGKINTTTALACRMVGGVVSMMVSR